MLMSLVEEWDLVKDNDHKVNCNNVRMLLEFTSDLC